MSDDRDQESSQDREQEPTEDREQEPAEDREQDSSEDREQDSSDDQGQDSSDDQGQDSSDDQGQDSSEAREQDSSDDHDEDSSGDREQDSGGGSKRRTAAWAIAAVRSQFTDLSGRSLEQVTGVDKGEDSTWTVGVEVVEIRMVPDTADILAQYDVKVDQDGDIIGYRRVRRYLRGRADG